jgi:hypothetical protein
MTRSPETHTILWRIAPQRKGADLAVRAFYIWWRGTD